MDELDGTDIDAARWLADEQAFGAALDLAGKDDFLLVSAREIGSLQRRVRRADIIFFNLGPGPCLNFLT